MPFRLHHESTEDHCFSPWGVRFEAKRALGAILSAMLCVSLVIGFLPVSAFGQEKSGRGIDEAGLIASEDNGSVVVPERWFRFENPLYTGPGETKEVEPLSLNAPTLLSENQETTYVSYDEAVEIITKAMAGRQKTVSVSLETDKNYADLSSTLFFDAMEEDGNPEHGDYLRWVWGAVNYGMSGTGNGSTGVYSITYTYTIEYFTTAAQEQELMAKVDEALRDMNLDEKSAYEKTKAIYEYICENVSYDYDNLKDDAYKLKHTAYAAFMDGKAVCQGYASLFYLMAGKSELSARIVAGIGNGKAHGWNIVRLDNGYYYNVDATWDSSRDRYAYFLKSDDDFPGHIRGIAGAEVDYASDDFYAVYPMAATSFDPTVEPEVVSIDVPVAVENLVYSGFEQIGVPEGEGYELSGTSAAIDAGEYTAIAIPVAGYAWLDGTMDPVAIEWSIARASYDMSDVSFSGSEVTYDGEPHSILVEGNLPVGVNVSYEGNGVIDAGTYRVTASFGVDANHEPIDSMVALLTIEPVNVSTVNMSIVPDLTCTGSAIEPELFLFFNDRELKEGADYTVFYANNVNPGIATITITGIGNFTDTTDVSFKILEAAGLWERDPNGWRYKNPDGTYATDCWQEIGGELYRFDADGYMKTGWLKDGGHWYYLKSSGAMASSEWEKVGGCWYHFAGNGIMEIGWFKEDGSRYWLKSSGAMACSEWEKIDGYYYHFASSGAMQAGWLKDAGEWYYLKSNGKMACSEWEEVDAAWYYFNGSGIMQASKWIGSYYVLASGKMATSQWIGQYYVGADGKWIPGYGKVY